MRLGRERFEEGSSWISDSKARDKSINVADFERLSRPFMQSFIAIVYCNRLVQSLDTVFSFAEKVLERGCNRLDDLIVAHRLVLLDR